jgi:hypothetical protein
MSTWERADKTGAPDVALPHGVVSLRHCTEYRLAVGIASESDTNAGAVRHNMLYHPLDPVPDLLISEAAAYA